MIDYTSLLQSLWSYIRENSNETTPLLDLICEFCVKNGLDETMVGDAISEDAELSELVKWHANSKNNTKLENF